MEQTINLNAAHCIEKANSFGYITLTNICNGKITQVPWGSADWIVALGLCAVVACFISVMAVMAFKFATDF